MSYNIKDLTYELRIMPFYEQELYLDVSRIPNAGTGVFSNIYIPPNTIITEYAGKHYSENKIFSKDVSKYILRTDLEYQINPYESSISRYINDIIDVPTSIREGKLYKYPYLHYNVNWLSTYNPNEPNLLYSENIFIETIAPIEPGEELYINYSSGYWRSMLNLKTPVLKGEDIQKMLVNMSRKLSDRENRFKTTNNKSYRE